MERDDRCRRGDWVGQVFLALLVFGITGWWVSYAAGDPDLGGLTQKLHYFTAHKDEYDLVFVGSSRLKRGLVPERLDAHLAARGIPVRSFNFGVAGMEPHLARTVIRRLLALEPARLRWLIVEMGDWDPRILPANRFKRRTIFRHDLVETRAAFRSTARAELSTMVKAERVADHALHFVVRTLGAGRGRDVIRRFAIGTPQVESMPGQGFAPYDARWLAAESRHPMRRKFVRELPDYRRAVARMARQDLAARVGSGPTVAYDVAALQAQTAMVRGAGVEPLSLVPPIPRATPELVRLARLGLVPGLLAYNDPRAYPALYDESHRFDHEHLTETGALIWTQNVARHLADQIGPRVVATTVKEAR